MRQFVLAVGQWRVVHETETNLDRAETFLREASAAGASMCLLPEMFQTPYDTTILRQRAEAPDGPSLGRIRNLARELSMYIVAGSICEQLGDHVCNSSYVFGPDGQTLGVHRKIHLFDVYFEDLCVEESTVISAGDRPLVIRTPLCTLGVAICYDVRFPEVFRYFEEKGVEVALLPAAFSKPTGEAHWHLVMRTRAVDHQIYLAAACPSSDPTAPFVTYGHSLIVDPWGNVLAEAGDSDENISVSLSPEFLDRVRNRLPALAHRRRRLYKTWFVEE
ncbi:MAG: carbon-nitrogen hydrolase family protein [Candidatus Odinarchaeota archaeon]